MGTLGSGAGQKAGGKGCCRSLSSMLDSSRSTAGGPELPPGVWVTLGQRFSNITRVFTKVHPQGVCSGQQGEGGWESACVAHLQ